MPSIFTSLLAALLPQIESAALPALEQIIANAFSNLFHHNSPNPAGTSTPTLPPSSNVVTPAKDSAPSVPGNAFVPHPGALKILGAINSNTGQPVHMPFGDDTHIHLDHNLLNPLPWPDALSGVQIIYTYDGQPMSSSDPCDGGSIDPDGYASRFNIHTLPDNKPHKIEIAMRIGSETGPWFLVTAQKSGSPLDRVYQAGYYRCEDSGISAGKPATGVKVAVYYNGQNKDLATPELPFSDPAAAEAWIKTNPPLGAILKSPFKF